MFEPGRKFVLLALAASVLVSCSVPLKELPPPPGMPAFKIDVDASEVESDNPEYHREYLSKILQQWSDKYLKTSLSMPTVPARFKARKVRESTAYIFMAFPPFVLFMLADAPIGSDKLSLEIELETGGKLYQGISKTEHSGGIYSLQESRENATKNMVYEALHNAEVHSSVTGGGL